MRVFTVLITLIEMLKLNVIFVTPLCNLMGFHLLCPSFYSFYNYLTLLFLLSPTVFYLLPSRGRFSFIVSYFPVFLNTVLSFCVYPHPPLSPSSSYFTLIFSSHSLPPPLHRPVPYSASH